MTSFPERVWVYVSGEPTTPKDDRIKWERSKQSCYVSRDPHPDDKWRRGLVTEMLTSESPERRTEIAALLRASPLGVAA